MNEILNEKLCRECGGRCCQGSPGIWVDPERFFANHYNGLQLTLERLRECLSRSEMVFWEKTGTAIPAPRSMETGCTFLAADGCRLSPSERPCQCLALVPRRETLTKKEGCLCQLPDGYSREQAAKNWQRYWTGVETRDQELQESIEHPAR